MQSLSLERALAGDDALPPVLHEALLEVLSAVNERAKSLTFCAFDILKQMTLFYEPLDQELSSSVGKYDKYEVARLLRIALNKAYRNNAPFLAACECDDEYAYAMNSVMYYCLESVVACHALFIRTHNVVLSAPSETPHQAQFRQSQLKSFALDAHLCLKHLPDIFHVLLLFFMLEVRLPNAGENLSARQADVERREILMRAGQLAADAIVLSLRLVIATWDLVPLELSQLPTEATLASLRMHVLLFSAVATMTKSATAVCIDAENVIRLHNNGLSDAFSAQLLKSGSPPRTLLGPGPGEQVLGEWQVDARALQQESPHEMQRRLCKLAISPHFGQNMQLAAESEYLDPLSATVHDALVRVRTSLSAILRPCGLRCSASMRRALGQALNSRCLSSSKEEACGFPVALGLQLAQTADKWARMGTSCEPVLSTSNSHIKLHPRLQFVLVFVGLVALPPLLPAEGGAQMLACLLPQSLALCDAGCFALTDSSIGYPDGMASVIAPALAPMRHQMELLGALATHALVSAATASQLQTAAWAVSALLLAWDTTTASLDMPCDPHSPAGHKRRWSPEQYVTSLLLSRSLHSWFAACANQSQVLGLLHNYLEMWMHKVRIVVERITLPTIQRNIPKFC